MNFQEGVEIERRRVVCISDGPCFGASCARRDYGRCARIERGDTSCGRKGRKNSGGEGELKVAEGATSKVGGYRRRDRVQ